MLSSIRTESGWDMKIPTIIGSAWNLFIHSVTAYIVYSVKWEFSVSGRTEKWVNECPVDCKPDSR